MKLRMRFIVIMALFILSLTILATYISTRLLLSNALALERELVREAIEGGRHFLASEEKQFADITLDWARWDDAYQFVADTNSAFIDANLVDGTFQSLNLSAIAFFDRTGSLVYSKGYDLLSRTERPVHAFLLESLVRLPALRAPSNEPNALSGLLPIGTEIWMLAAAPILTSSDGGPARGTLVMARRLDNLSDWCPSRHWHGMFTLKSAPPGAAPLEIQAESLGRISGRAILRDLSGAPSLLLETSIARRILANGISGQFFLTGWILLSGAAIGLFAFWLVDRWVLQHLSNSVEALKQGVSAVTARANLKLRLKTMQEGEMKELANCLNDMLNALDQAQQASESRRRDLIQAQKMTALGTLVAGVAHEVNNPNTVVGLNLTALQRRLDKALAAETPPAEREALKADITALLAETRDATRRIAAIAASLKGFARPASEKMDALIAVNDLIRHTSELLKHTLAKANCTLTASLADPSPTLFGNEQQLSQVLINLVENACQASPESGRPIVIVSEKGTDGGARVTVRDQGRGILPEHLDRIFEPFFTTRRSQGGTGLGLAISREIIQAHGGTISIRSVPDEGSEFIVDFPPPVRKEVS